MSTRVVALGALYLDIICTDFPYEGALWPEREVIGPGYRIVPGGSATNFACTSAGLGLKASLVGKIGDDFPGHALRQALARWNVDLHAAHSRSDQTNLGISFNGDEGPIMTAAGSANQTMHPDEILPVFRQVATGADYVYFGGCLKLQNLLPALPPLAAELREQGIQVIVDHGRVFNTLTEDSAGHVRALCAQADLYMPSSDELMGLWRAASIEEAAETVSKISDATIVVKNGAAGATCFAKDQVLMQQGRRVSVVSHVGAGDAFNAGFVSAHAQAKTLQECLSVAVATAALRISTGQYPDASDVKRLLADG